MKRRDFTKGVLAAVGTGLAAADGRAPALAQEKVTLSFLHKWPEPQNIVFFQNAVSAFQTAHPNVTINMDAVADDPYKEKIRVAMASGEIPDVYFTWVGEYTRQFIRAGRVLDITQYLSAPAWQGRFAPATLDAYKTDGKIYGVPIEVDAKFMIYNKALFAKAGIDAPPAEWPTFAGALNKLKAAQITPISFGAQLAWATVHYIGDLNAKLVPSDVRLADYTLRAAPEKLFTDPGYVQSLTLYRDFLTNGWFNKSPDAYTHAAARASFVAGRAGMMYQELVELAVSTGPSWHRTAGISFRCRRSLTGMGPRTCSPAHRTVSWFHPPASIRMSRSRSSTFSPRPSRASSSRASRAGRLRYWVRSMQTTRRRKHCAASTPSTKPRAWYFGSTPMSRAGSPLPSWPEARG